MLLQTSLWPLFQSRSVSQSPFHTLINCNFMPTNCTNLHIMLQVHLLSAHPSINAAMYILCKSLYIYTTHIPTCIKGTMYLNIMYYGSIISKWVLLMHINISCFHLPVLFLFRTIHAISSHTNGPATL